MKNLQLFPNEIWLEIFSFLQPWLTNKNYFKTLKKHQWSMELKQLESALLIMNRISKQTNHLIKKKLDDPVLIALLQSELFIPNINRWKKIKDFRFFVNNAENSKAIEQTRGLWYGKITEDTIVKSRNENEIGADVNITIKNRRDRRFVFTSVLTVILASFILCSVFTRSPHFWKKFALNLVTHLFGTAVMVLGFLVYNAQDPSFPLYKEEDINTEIQKDLAKSDYKNLMTMLATLNNDKPEEYRKHFTFIFSKHLSNMGYENDQIDIMLPLIFKAVNFNHKLLIIEKNAETKTEIKKEIKDDESTSLSFKPMRIESEDKKVGLNPTGMFYSPVSKNENDLGIQMEEIEELKEEKFQK